MRLFWNIVSVLTFAYTALSLAVLYRLRSLRAKANVPNVGFAEPDVVLREDATAPEVEEANFHFINAKNDAGDPKVYGRPDPVTRDMLKHLDPYFNQKAGEVVFEGRNPEEIWAELLKEMTDEELFYVHASKGSLNTPQGLLVLRIVTWMKSLFDYWENGYDDGVVSYEGNSRELAHISVLLSILCGMELWRRADPGTGVKMPDNPFDDGQTASYMRKPNVELLETYIGNIFKEGEVNGGTN